MTAINKPKDEFLLRGESDLSGVALDRYNIVETSSCLLVDLQHRATAEKGGVDVTCPDPAGTQGFVNAGIENIDSINLLAVFPCKSCQLDGPSAHVGADFNYVSIQSL